MSVPSKRGEVEPIARPSWLPAGGVPPCPKPTGAAAGIAAQLDVLGPDTPIELRRADGVLLVW